jgi:hypothetical protein
MFRTSASSDLCPFKVPKTGNSLGVKVEEGADGAEGAGEGGFACSDEGLVLAHPTARSTGRQKARVKLGFDFMMF